jgi:hypothetical protein
MDAAHGRAASRVALLPESTEQNAHTEEYHIPPKFEINR